MNNFEKTSVLLMLIALIFSNSCQDKQTTLSAHDLVKQICVLTNSKGKTIEDVSKSSLGINIYAHSETIQQFTENLNTINYQTKEQWHQAIQEELINDPNYLIKVKPLLKGLETALKDKSARFDEESFKKVVQESKCFSLYQLLPMLITAAEKM